MLKLKTDCPAAKVLEDLLEGKLVEPELQTLAEHLETCSTCQERARTISPEDTLVSSLRANSPAAETIARQVPRALVEKIKQLAGEDKPAGGSHDATIDTMASVLRVPEANSSTEFLAPPQQPDEIGRLGSYRILKVLGKGGMGVVFLADDPKLDRKVAIKAMLPKVAANPSARERFLREARTAAKLRNDHIVTIFQVAEDRGVPFLAMELLEGMPLDDLFKTGQHVDLAEVLRIGREIAQGLAAAHEKGLVHRDIKPGNLWLDQGHGGRLKILDFGLARLEQDDVHLTQSGTIVGTPAYMAPEQAQGEKNIDARADLFALGCVLYRLCAGSIPFQSETAMGMLVAVVTKHPDAPVTINTQVPPALSDLIMQLLEKDPAKRPGSAREVCDRIRAIEQSTGSQANETGALPAAATTQVAAPAVSMSAADTVLATTLSATKPAAAKSRGGLWTAVALGLLLLGGGAFGVYQLYFDTPNGRLNVQIEGEDIEARFKNGKIILFKDGKELYTLLPGEKIKDIPAGKYGLEIKGAAARLKVIAADGLEIDTDKFEMKRGGKVIVRVVLEPIAVAQTNKKTDPKDVKGPKDEPKDVKLVKTPRSEYALHIGKALTVPAITVDLSKDVTIEAFVRNYMGNEAFIMGFPQLGVCLFADWFALRVPGDPGDHHPGHVRKGSGRYHVALVKSAASIRLYVDGNLIKAVSQREFKDAGQFTLGQHSQYDEIRVSQAALYYENFKPPTEPLKANKDTVALYHCDEGKGDTLKDASGRNHHVKLPEDAKWVKDGLFRPDTREFALLLASTDKKAAIVELPSLNVGPSGPIVLETWVIPIGDKEGPVLGNEYLRLIQGSDCWKLRTPDGELRVPRVESNEPVHLAAVRDMSDVQFFVNGRPAGRLAVAEAARAANPLALGGPGAHMLLLGCRVSSEPPLNFWGQANLSDYAYIRHNFRNGFSPDRVFVKTSTTLALFDVNDGKGSDLKDSGGIFHHGKIAHGLWVPRHGSVTAPANPRRLPLPAEEQIEWFCARLYEANPGATSFVIRKIDKGEVTEVSFGGGEVKDLASIRALTGLKKLAMHGVKINDLAVLKGLPLVSLDISNSSLTDLSPLEGMKLTHFNCERTAIANLYPLRHAPLEVLNCDLTKVTDLNPLKSMPLKELHLVLTQVKDLMPLKDLKLTHLSLVATPVSDLSPLKNMPLKELNVDPTLAQRESKLLRSIGTLEKINGKPVR